MVHPYPSRKWLLPSTDLIDLEASHAVVSEESLQMIPEDFICQDVLSFLFKDSKHLQKIPELLILFVFSLFLLCGI